MKKKITLEENIKDLNISVKCDSEYITVKDEKNIPTVFTHLEFDRITQIVSEYKNMVKIINFSKGK